MARFGVTYTDVAAAASELIGQGKNPTIEQIRLFLGTGSSTTLANHLKQWKASQGQSSKLACKENLPEEFVALMKVLWERVVDEANDKISQVEAASLEKITVLEQELVKYKKNNQRWQKLYNQYADEKASLITDKIAAEELATQVQSHYSALKQEHQALVPQLQEKNERVKELQRLHQQLQENLEHFRESARTQRLVEQQRFESEKLRLQKIQDRLTELNEDLNTQHKNLQHQFNKLEKSAHEHERRTQSYQQLNQELNQKLEAQNRQVMELQTESRVLATHLTQLNQKLDESLDKQKQMEGENRVLIREKAQLQGQLTQMQSFIASLELTSKA